MPGLQPGIEFTTYYRKFTYNIGAFSIMVNTNMMDELIHDLESEFGTMIWEPIWKNDYHTDPKHVTKLFQLYNKHIFNGELPPLRCIIKRMNISALAAFGFGMVKGTPVAMEVYNATYTSFFMLMNSVAHELIHYYDWLKGPLNRMFEMFRVIHFEGNATSVYNPGHPTQVVFDPRYRDYRQAIAAGAKVYDVHARWFTNQADKFNSKGFDVTDVFCPRTAKPGLRRIDEDPDETPLGLRNLNDAGPIRAMYDLIRSDDHKTLQYRDPDNWIIEIA